jgi:predicted membrane metal-binding protein
VTKGVLVRGPVERLAHLPAAHLLAGALCAGLALALPVRAARPLLALAACVLALAGLAAGPRRAAFLGGALALSGLWWGSVRLEALDSSLLKAEIGRAAPARVEVTGPARRSEFALRVPVQVLRFGRVDLRERARLDLPPERSPPQGAILELVVTVARPREPEEDGDFDEAGYLRRQGVHVVLRGGSYRVVGRRGGLGGAADRLRKAVSRSLTGVPPGERRAVVAGVVLGEDEGLDDELRDRFRASGLYHLLRKFKTSGLLGVAPRRPRAASKRPAGRTRDTPAPHHEHPFPGLRAR